MPRLPSGEYVLPMVPVVPFTVITSDWANTTTLDIATALTQSIAVNGLTTAQADLPMGGFRHTGVGKAVEYNQYARADQVQLNEFNVVGLPTGGPVAYAGTLPFNIGSVTLPQEGMTIVYRPPVANTGTATLALNGGTAYPILSPAGANITAGRLVANQPIQLIWNSLSSGWTLVSNSANVVATVTSADPEMLTATTPTPNNVLLTPIVNVSGGMVKLGPDGKLPATIMPATQVLLGMWDASTGLPPDATVGGQYYIISAPGTLTVYMPNGSGGWVATPTSFVVGDQLLWNNAAGQPTGWYKIAAASAAIASSVANVATPAIAGTNLQTWINNADSSAGFALTNGSRRFTGNVLAPTFVVQDGAGLFGFNIVYSGGWVFTSAAGYGNVRVMQSEKIVDYMTNAASTGVGSTATVVDYAYWSLASSWVRSAWGVGAAPRVSGAGQYALDVQGGGWMRSVLQSVDNQAGIRTSVGSGGYYHEYMRMDAAGNVAAGQTGLPVNFQLTDAWATNGNIMRFDVYRGITFGDNAHAIPGSVTSTYKVMSPAVYTGVLDMRNYQTAMLQAGSNITQVVMNPGQIARIWVYSGGSITLPAAVHIPRGGALWGTVFTLIGLFANNDTGTVMMASFTPYDS